MDTALRKTVERIDCNRPDYLAAERIRIGIAEIIVAILVFAEFVLLAEQA
jgi:hypothetical protein